MFHTVESGGKNSKGEVFFCVARSSLCLLAVRECSQHVLRLAVIYRPGKEACSVCPLTAAMGHPTLISHRPVSPCGRVFGGDMPSITSMLFFVSGSCLCVGE